MPTFEILPCNATGQELFSQVVVTVVDQNARQITHFIASKRFCTLRLDRGKKFEKKSKNTCSVMKFAF
jgi:hypothetical protein